MIRKHGITLIEVLVALTVLSIGGLAVMRYASQAREMAAEAQQLDTMSGLAAEQLAVLETDGLSASLQRNGGFEEQPDYTWKARARVLRPGGWYCLELTVTREDTGRTLVVERVFREGS